MTELELRGLFDELCAKTSASDEGSGRLDFDGWLSWEWLNKQIGPPGSSALLTPVGAESIWNRIVPPSPGTAGADEFVQLANAVASDCQRATAIQAWRRSR